MAKVYNKGPIENLRYKDYADIKVGDIVFDE